LYSSTLSNSSLTVYNVPSVPLTASTCTS
jgi:hypothetical protein